MSQKMTDRSIRWDVERLALETTTEGANMALSRLEDELRRARSEEARLLEENRAKDEMLAEAYREPVLLAWRAGSPHGFSRVYADTEEQARERGALLQRCEASAINAVRWPEEDLCTARQVAEKDATIKALADALERGAPRSVGLEDVPCWCMGADDHDTAPSQTCVLNTAALRLVGRIT